MRIKISATVFVCLLSMLSAHSNAATCLTIENLKGEAAYSYGDYQMGPDGIAMGTLGQSIRFCYDGDDGEFVRDGTDEKQQGSASAFSRLGSDTWIRHEAIEGTDLVEVLTFDFQNRKALFTRNRGIRSMLPATVAAFVGDIVVNETL